MSRTAAIILVLAVSAGCLAGPKTSGTGVPSETGPDDSLQRLTFFLKGGYRLDPTPPVADSPTRVPFAPTSNAFLNEDLRDFQSAPLPSGLVVVAARVVAYYETEGPTLDAFLNASNPSQARALVFWLGSHQIYPQTATTMGEPVVLSGRTYRAEASFPRPPGGWIVPEGERLQLLLVPLLFSHPLYPARLLVDAPETPSRIELDVGPTGHAVPSDVDQRRSAHLIPANSGLFTGATEGRLPSRVRVPVPVSADDLYLEVRVRFVSNAGGKSDLDFLLYAPDGRIGSASTTPYQNETVRLFPPQLSLLGAGDYVADVEAYSGFNTRFELETTKMIIG